MKQKHALQSFSNKKLRQNNHKNIEGKIMLCKGKKKEKKNETKIIMYIFFLIKIFRVILIQYTLEILIIITIIFFKNISYKICK